jgi:hypothetical protein
VIRQQLHDTTDIGLVHEAGAAGAQLAHALGSFVASVMATPGGIALEAFRCLAKTLRRAPVGLQLGHRFRLLL